jgi:filamentous hemagglutinin family protein
MRLFPRRVSGCSLLLSLACWTSLVHAAAPITPSGLNTKISDPVITAGGKTQYDITGGTRPGGGTNLFHSFGDFNVPTNNVANFLNDSGLPTSNILGRVTGGNPSSIFGMIQTTGFGNANLFLMNPYGFLFGPNATLNVGGMVAFTTANYLRFQGTETVFDSASTPQSLSMLTTAPVAAFGFLGSDPAAIAIQGSTLQVAEGKSLSLVGGNKGFTATDPDNGQAIQVPGGITMTGGKLLASGGQINMASVAGPGEISAADFMPTVGMAMGNISLSQGALLDVSADAAGTVRIRGGQFVMDQAIISADTVNGNGAPVAIDINVEGNLSISNTDVPALTARTTGTGNAGEIMIVSSSMDVTSTFNEATFFFPTIDTHTAGSGNAGNVTINTGDLTVIGDPSGASFFIDSGTSGPTPGHGGNVSITGKTIDFETTGINTGNLFAFFLDQGGAGTAGNVTINAEKFRMNFSQIVTDSNDFITPVGTSGDITVAAREVDFFASGLSTTAYDHSGNIRITADRFIATESQIQAITTFQTGGEIRITGKVIEFREGSNIASSTMADGDAGPIIITASDHVAFLESSPGGRPGGIFNNSFGDRGSLGNAGDVVITTPNLQLTGGTRINTTTASSGRGGNVTINADSISISGENSGFEIEPLFNLGTTQSSGIFTRTIGGNCVGPCGDAGNISITTGSLIMGSGAQINSGTSSSGQGGNITITAAKRIDMSGTLTTGQPGGIHSRSIGTGSDAGDGGDISLIAGQSVSILNGAAVSANTTGPGNAGNILVKANDITISGGGMVSASSTGAGNAGIVTIEGPNSPANSLLVVGNGSGVFTTTSSTGTGGDISIDSNAVILQNGGRLSSSSTGTGIAGDIRINAGNQFTMTNSTVTTEALHSSGGTIKITTTPNGTVQLTDSTISASVLDGTGGGGSVNIDPQFVILQNSQILAKAVDGPGGNIFITTNLLLPDTTSVISASSQFGQQGTVIIQSPVSPASGKIVPLSQRPLVETSLVSQRCAAVADGKSSSFTIAGRDTLPTEPGNWLSSPLALTVSREGEALPTSQTPIEERPLLSLRRIAPPGFLTQNFAVDSAGCTS